MRKLHTFGPLILALGAIGVGSMLFVNMDTAKWIHSNLLEEKSTSNTSVQVAIEETEVGEEPLLRDNVRTAITEMQVNENPYAAAEKRIVAPPAISFKDVQEDYFAKQAITNLAGAGVLRGYENGLFKPYSSVNRAEWAKMMVLAIPAFFEQEASKDEIALSDVQSDDWFSAYVITLADHKVVQGYADGTFRSGKPVTRAEALKMLVVASGMGEDAVKNAYTSWTAEGNDISKLFQDISGDQWFAPYIYVAHSQGFIKGKIRNNMNFAEPLAELSRGEAAVFLERLRMQAS